MCIVGGCSYHHQNYYDKERNQWKTHKKKKRVKCEKKLGYNLGPKIKKNLSFLKSKYLVTFFGPRVNSVKI